MKQLTFKDLIELFNGLKKEYPVEEIMKMPIYIGDDDELNGIHCAWGCQMLNRKDEFEEDEYLIHMINDTAGNNELKDKGVLIS